jgi:hypothetical protein
MEMDKIPTPVIVAGGAIVALLLMRAASGSGPAVKTIGPVSDPSADQLAAADVQAKSQGFQTLVNAVTNMDTELARLRTGITLEEIRGKTLTDVSQITANVQEKRDQLAAKAAAQESADQLAAARSAQKGQTNRDLLHEVFSIGTSIAKWLFG